MILEKFALKRESLIQCNLLHYINIPKHGWQKPWLGPFKGKTVVVTHHTPTHWSWNDSPNAVKKLAYCNDLKPLFHKHDISAWFHGHTHSIGDYRIEDARILSNTRGYAGRKEVDGFDLNRIVVI